MKSRLQVFNEMLGCKPIIGMVHLPALPGSAPYDGKGLDSVIEFAVNEAKALQQSGVSGIEVENFHDRSYFPNHAVPELTASMAIIAHEIRKVTDLPLGICILADPIASLSVAHSAKCQFVRVTTFIEACVGEGGISYGRPHEILRYRKFLDPSIKIFADVHTKHGAPLAERPIEDSAYDAANFLADGVIVTGRHTGFPTSIADVKGVKGLLPDVPVIIGSGLNSKTVNDLFQYADGAIVGSTLKVDGDASNPVDPERAKALISVVSDVRAKVCSCK